MKMPVSVNLFSCLVISQNKSVSVSHEKSFVLNMLLGFLSARQVGFNQLIGKETKMMCN